MILRLLAFLLLNFGALALGGLATGNGVISDWYTSLTKAPWTPPGWVFGFAWTTIMVCFSVYMAKAWAIAKNRTEIAVVFGLQWLLNVSWNPVFFSLHYTTASLFIILALLLVVAGMLFGYRKELGHWSWLIVPYVMWLVVASSLNGYIWWMN
jgi:translocator protein